MSKLNCDRTKEVKLYFKQMFFFTEKPRLSVLLYIIIILQLCKIFVTVSWLQNFWLNTLGLKPKIHINTFPRAYIWDNILFRCTFTKLNFSPMQEWLRLLTTLTVNEVV